MKHSIRIILLGLLLLVSGCVNLTNLEKELSKDPACVSVSVSTIYGTAKLSRVGAMGTNSVSLTPDGTISINK